MSHQRKLVQARQDVMDSVRALLAAVVTTSVWDSTVTVTEDAYRGLHQSYADYQVIAFDLDGEAAASARDTSIATSKIVLPRARSLRRAVLNALDWRQSVAQMGATCEWLEYHLKRPHTSVSSAVNYLENAGLIRDSRERGTTRAGCPAIIYVITDEVAPIVRRERVP